jgi:hypothetical protein
MANAMMPHHVGAYLALALCSLPKMAAVGFRLPRSRPGSFAGRVSAIRTALPLRTSLAVVPGALGGGLQGGVTPPRGGDGNSGGDGRGGDQGGWGRADDGADDGFDLSSGFFTWLASDQVRRAAFAGVGWAAALTWTVQVAQREVDVDVGARVAAAAAAADETSALAAAGPAAFAGVWVLSGSENFDAYLASVGVSSLHRRYACSASVSQTIEACVEDGRPALSVCVRNQLGSRCEKSPMDGKSISSVDARGEPLTKTTSVAPPCAGEFGPVCVTEVRHSRNGVMYERRFLGADGTMVMELTSPSGVVARRIFSKQAPMCAPPDAPPSA